MAKLNTLPLEPWIRYFSTFTESTFERMQEAVEDLEAEKYTPARFMSDGVRFWLDVTVGWWNAMQASAVSPTPIVFLRMSRDDEAPKAHIPVTIGKNATVKKTDLVRVGSAAGAALKGQAGAAPTAKQLDVSLGDKPGHLTVTYRNVPAVKGKAKAQPLAPGVYQSLLHANNKLVAVVQLLVE